MYKIIEGVTFSRKIHKQQASINSSRSEEACYRHAIQVFMRRSSDGMTQTYRRLRSSQKIEAEVVKDLYPLQKEIIDLKACLAAFVCTRFLCQ